MSEKITGTEARILIYLSVVHKTRRDVETISHKLNISYGYVLTVLSKMNYKEWVVKYKYKRHTFYNLTDKAPIEQAVIDYANAAQDIKQKSLNDPYLGVEE